MQWSPNQERVAAIGYPTGSRVYLSGSRGEKHQVSLSEDYGWKWGLSWHPDGNRLTYLDSDHQLVREVNLDGGASRVLMNDTSG